MARLSKAQHHLILVSVAALFCIERVSACPSFEKDYYPVKPQTSNAPYMLNVTDEDGRSVYNMYERPHYGPGQMTYTSKILKLFRFSLPCFKSVRHSLWHI